MFRSRTSPFKNHQRLIQKAVWFCVSMRCEKWRLNTEESQRIKLSLIKHWYHNYVHVESIQSSICWVVSGKFQWKFVWIQGSLNWSVLLLFSSRLFTTARLITEIISEWNLDLLKILTNITSDILIQNCAYITSRWAADIWISTNQETATLRRRGHVQLQEVEISIASLLMLQTPSTKSMDAAMDVRHSKPASEMKKRHSILHPPPTPASIFRSPAHFLSVSPQVCNSSV